MALPSAAMTGLRAVFFDFDGLILDTEDACYAAWRSLFEKHGVDYPLEEFQEIVGTAGSPRARLEEKLGRALDWARLEPERRELEDALGRHLAIKPGVLRLLHEALEFGCKRAVVSSSPHRWVRGHLDSRGALDLFETFVCREDVERVKPSPDLYEEALRRFGVAPHEAVAFEDSYNGTMAAKAAGLWCVAVPNRITRSMDFSHVDLVVESLEDVTLEALDAQFCAGRTPA